MSATNNTLKVQPTLISNGPDNVRYHSYSWTQNFILMALISARVRVYPYRLTFAAGPPPFSHVIILPLSRLSLLSPPLSFRYHTLGHRCCFIRPPPPHPVVAADSSCPPLTSLPPHSLPHTTPSSQRNPR
jgi:hypothetical protein